MASEYSGAATRARAEELARAIGAVHTSIKIDAMTSAVRATFEDISLHTDQFSRASMRTKPAMEGGTVTENLALQNIQARARARASARRVGESSTFRYNVRKRRRTFVRNVASPSLSLPRRARAW